VFPQVAQRLKVSQPHIFEDGLILHQALDFYHDRLEARYPPLDI